VISIGLGKYTNVHNFNKDKLCHELNTIDVISNIKETGILIDKTINMPLQRKTCDTACFSRLMRRWNAPRLTSRLPCSWT
jgi:hypothetical protein